MVSRFTVSDLEAKRLIVSIAGSNLFLQDKKLNIDARKPFRAWSKSSIFSDLGGFVKDIRTFMTEQSPEAMEMIAAIRQLSNELQQQTSPRVN